MFPILFAQAIASTIGVNSIGIKLGGINHSIDISPASSNSMHFTGFAYEINANFNLHQFTGEKNIGIDVPVKFVSAPSLEEDAASIDGTTLNVSLRPYLAMGNGYLFADVGLSYISVQTSGGSSILSSADFSETSFAFGIGGLINLSENTNFSPSLNWASYGGVTHDESILLAIPFSYTLSEKYDLSLAYEHTFFSSTNIGGASIEPKMDTFLLGLDMKF